MKKPVKERVRSFIEAHISPSSVEENDDIFQLGLVNSLFAMQLVTFSETEFGVSVERHELNIDTFKSIKSLSDFIECKLKST